MPEEFDNMFENELSNPSDVVKEIFNGENPKVKTDLTENHISIIAKLYYFAKISNLKDINNLLNEFIVLRISKNRMSREEFVRAFQLSDNVNKQAGMFASIGNAMTRK